MVYRITAKQKNFTAESVTIPPYMNEKGAWRKMLIDRLEINDVTLAWHIIKGIIEDFVEYAYENEGEWSVHISRTRNGREFDYFEVYKDVYDDNWDVHLSNWLE